MTQYWVVGGEYADTSFAKIAAGKAEERLGPFEDYDAAHKAWAARAWATVDDANARFRIVAEEG
jgi:Domain of unknown function (DUF4170)